MELAYLSINDAQRKLKAVGSFSSDVVDNLPAIANVLEECEIKLDTWLGYRAAPTWYREVYTSNAEGVVVLANYPVLAVKEVLPFAPEPIYSLKSEPQQVMMQIEAAPTTGQATSITPIRTFEGGQTGRVVRTNNPGSTMAIGYQAGLAPIPRIFSSVIFQMLVAALNNSGTSGDLSFLDEPTKDVASLSLPGGLSKSFKVGAGSKSEGLGETQIDRLLAPLAPYRKMYLT